MAEAKAAVKRVLETIEHGKKNEVTSENPSIHKADEVRDNLLLKKPLIFVRKMTLK